MSEMLLHLDAGLYRVPAESLELGVAPVRGVEADARNWAGIAGSGGGRSRGRGMSCGSVATLSSRWSARLSSLCRSPASSSVRSISLRPHSLSRRLPGPSCDARGSPFPARNLLRFVPVRASSVTGMAEVEVMDAVQQRLMFEDECILVDEHDNVVGHDSKYNCHLMAKIEAENLLHRAFSVFLFNSKNELLLQKRSATKVTFPEVWTNTCCSHPLYRDSELIVENNLGVRNAAQRKLFDELGIVAKDAPVDEFTVLGRILYKAPSDGKWGEHELDYLLVLKKDVEVKPNPDEVSDVQFVNKEQLLEIVRKADAGEDGIKLSPWFRIVVDNFLFGWWKKLEDGTLPDAVDLSIHKL